MFECPFLSAKRVDSYQKLGLLLWLDRCEQESLSLLELAEQLFIADLPLLERALAGLEITGVVQRTENRYRLIRTPEAEYCLACLAATFESPLARQGLLAQIAALGGGRNVRCG